MDFATLKPSGIQLPFTRAYSSAFNSITFHVGALGRPHNLYNIFMISQAAMFLLNSPPLFFLCQQNQVALIMSFLFPKLRKQFAEFLWDDYNNTLVFSTCPPVLVYDTAHNCKHFLVILRGTYQTLIIINSNNTRSCSVREY